MINEEEQEPEYKTTLGCKSLENMKENVLNGEIGNIEKWTWEVLENRSNYLILPLG